MQKQVRSLVSFATRWGPQFGGINSFNQDLLKAFAVAFSPQFKTFCIVLDASPDEIEDALNHQVVLISLGRGNTKVFSADFADNAWIALSSGYKVSDLGEIVWLGHDRITGQVALKASQNYGGQSALIKHMSYDHYEAFSENSNLAKRKSKEQKELFSNAHFVMAVGPLLRDALSDMLDRSNIPMLIPGLPDSIEVKMVNKTFSGFISGRLGNDAKKVKQGYLGIAAFAHAIYKADRESGLPTILRGENQPKLTLRGVDFEDYDIEEEIDVEKVLNSFAQQHAGRVVRMHALPFSTDRSELFDDLRSSSVTMMPSWHEGFGLVGWEAIAAGVPLVVSKNSGLYKFLAETEDGLYTSMVYEIDVLGDVEDPFFQSADKESLAQKIIEIAKNPDSAKAKAVRLRESLLCKHNWFSCAKELLRVLNWNEAESESEISPELLLIQYPQSSHVSSNILEMPTPIWRANKGLSNSLLLRAEEAVIPFDQARESFLAEQLDWAKSAEFPLAVRLLTGVGGTGKTRLAMELCNRLQELGWQVGFLLSDVDVRNIVTNLSQSGQPFFMVIDYAETRQQQLIVVLKMLIAAGIDQPVRVLLLARDGGEWWELLASKNSECEALLNGLATTGPYVLPKLHDSQESRQLAFKQCVEAFAEQISKSVPPNIPNLSDEHFSHPLYIQMAALLALYGEQYDSAESVARSLIGHERRYWQKALSITALLDSKQDENAALIMAFATMTNGLSTLRDAETLWETAGWSKSEVKPLFNVLKQLYPGRQGIDGLRPDLLGEALVTQCILSTDGHEFLTTILNHKRSAIRHNGLTVLARILRNREDLITVITPVLSESFLNITEELVSVIIETPSPLAYAAELAFMRLAAPKKYQACGVLEKHLGNENLPLADLSVLVYQAQLAKVNKSPKKEHAHAFQKAAALNNLAIALNRQGNTDEALECANQSLDIFEKLVASKLGRYEEDWAATLSNYAGILGKNGQIDEALKCSKQSLDIYEKLAALQPECFEVDWAMALNTYASALSQNGQIDDALKCAKQSIDIYEKLATSKPESFEMDWAMALNNYANRLSENGQFDDALECAKQSLDIYEKLATLKPERFEMDWAMALNNYANRLSENGQFDDALKCAKQSLDIYEKLAISKPERFEMNWAGALNNYANDLSENGQVDDALTFARQSLDIYEKLATSKPERFEVDWAMALNNYASCLSENGQTDDALKCAKKSLDIYERLAILKPERFEASWAGALNNYASRLSENGQVDDALKCAKLSLDIYEKLATSKPERYEVGWAGALNNYASRLSENGQVDDALKFAKLSLDVYERLATKKPERFEVDWAMALNNYASILSENGQVNDAFVYAKQSLVIYEKLAVTMPVKVDRCRAGVKLLIALCGWLIINQPIDIRCVQPLSIKQRDKRELDFKQNVLEALASSPSKSIKVLIGRAGLGWLQMDQSQRYQHQDYYLLLAGLAEMFEMSPEVVSQWRENLKDYKARRNDNLPGWMRLAAKKAGFEFKFDE